MQVKSPARNKLLEIRERLRLLNIWVNCRVRTPPWQFLLIFPSLVLIEDSFLLVFGETCVVPILLQLIPAMSFLCPRSTALAEIGFDLVLRHRLALFRVFEPTFDLVQHEQAFESVVECSIVRKL